MIRPRICRLILMGCILNFLLLSTTSTPYTGWGLWSLILWFNNLFIRPLLPDTGATSSWETEKPFYATLECPLYNWTDRSTPPKVFDAILFSIEVEFLELRMRLLDEAVDKFVIVESPMTFLGESKELFFNRYKETFKEWEGKICHHVIKDIGGGSKWDREDSQRRAVKEAVKNCGVSTGDLIIFSDLDELPRPELIHLLKKCEGFKQPLNFALRNYLYSFEWEDIAYYPNPRLTIWIWNQADPKFRYFPDHHQQLGDTLIHDGGWHCSWCFKYIEDFQWKMDSYSHYDQFASFLQHDAVYIQDVICSGKRLQGPYYVDYADSFADAFSKIQPIKPINSFLALPRVLIEHREKYKHLLPGGCLRELKRKATD